MQFFRRSFSIFLFLSSIYAYSSEYKWQSSEFVWNYGIAQIADIGLPRNPKLCFIRDEMFRNSNYSKIKKGDVVWMKPNDLSSFCSFAKIKKIEPVILIISGMDYSFPYECNLSEEDIHFLLNNPSISHIFAQNSTISNDKITQIPIGVDYHTNAYKDKKTRISNKEIRNQELIFQEIIKKSHTNKNKKIKLFVDFHLSDTIQNGPQKRYKELGENRGDIFEKLKETQLVDYISYKIPREELWKIKSKYLFSVSPHGNGLDCHRTWEDLLLGCIVIVKKSSLDDLYKDLPVVIVDSWDEITEQNLFLWKKKFEQLLENKTYKKKLYNSYWIQKIFQKKKEIYE